MATRLINAATTARNDSIGYPLGEPVDDAGPLALDTYNVSANRADHRDPGDAGHRDLRGGHPYSGARHYDAGGPKEAMRGFDALPDNSTCDVAFCLSPSPQRLQAVLRPGFRTAGDELSH
jgi:hypothetical protein